MAEDNKYQSKTIEELKEKESSLLRISLPHLHRI